MIHYFAYGSNMDKDDFKEWCNGENKQNKKYPMVNFQNPRRAKLNGYELTFNYYSCSREGGAANIMESQEDYVYGLLMDIGDKDLQTIREKEGYSEDCSKCYYNEVCVNVEVDGTVVQHVKTYKVSKCRETTEPQRPTRKYLGLIINNAEKYEFPPDYIKHIYKAAGIDPNERLI